MPTAVVWCGTRRPIQLLEPMKWGLSTWLRCSTPSGVGTARLIVSSLASASRRSESALEPHQIAVADAAAGEAQHHGPGPQRPAGAVALDERVPLERRDQPRDGALGQVGGLGQLAHSDRVHTVRDRHEQLGGPVDGLGSGGGRH